MSTSDDLSRLSYDAKMEIELEKALAQSSVNSLEASTTGSYDLIPSSDQVAVTTLKPSIVPRTSQPHTYENEDIFRKHKAELSHGSTGDQNQGSNGNDDASKALKLEGPNVDTPVGGGTEVLPMKSLGNGVKIDRTSPQTYQQGSSSGEQVTSKDMVRDSSNTYDDVIGTSGVNVDGSGSDVTVSQGDIITAPPGDDSGEYDDVANPLLASGGTGVSEDGRTIPDEIFYDDAFVPEENTKAGANTGKPITIVLPEPITCQQRRLNRSSSELDELYDQIEDDGLDTEPADAKTASLATSGGYDHLWNPKSPSGSGVYNSVSSLEMTPDDDKAVKDEPLYFDYDDAPLHPDACDAGEQNGEDEPLYEPIGNKNLESDSDESWGSEEFEEYDEISEGARKERKPLAEHVLNTTFLGRLGNTFRASKREPSPEEEGVYKDVDINSTKHPPPALPPMPDGLDSKQIKRRHIIASIVSSEQSYLESVTRLVKEYEQPLLDNPNILSKDKIRTMFFKLRDIRQIHLQFQIALKVTIDAWDQKEEIADVFIASFGKTIVFDVYSAFVNNFSLAMETVKLVSRQKQAFADFVKQKMMTSTDKLSIFGLMVKPVQRFPQFILQLQDLLKHTPEDHKDRLKLQMALTELENLAHKLNENKRESERKYAIRAVLSNLKLSQKAEERGISRTLIRQDNMMQVEYNSNGEMIKSKPRRMIILSDLLICATVMHRESSVDAPERTTEKYSIKWRVPIQEVEYVETAVTSHMQVNIFGGAGRTTLVHKEVHQEEPVHLHSEVSNMLHDRAVLAQISALSSSLKLAHKNFSADLIDGLLKDLQKTIYTKTEQLKVLEGSTIQLIIPANEQKRSRSHDQTAHGPHHKKYLVNRSTSTVRYFFRTPSPGLKRDWVLDFQASKLALDLKNRPAWVFPESTITTVNALSEVPLFFKPLPTDVTRLYTKISCGLPLYIVKSDLELQHLWICSSLPDRGQVTVLSMCSNKPHILQSFQACDEAITCAELVPGHAVAMTVDGFDDDTVWMGTVAKSIVVHSLPSQDVQDSTSRPQPKLTVTLPSVPTRLKFTCNRLIVGTENGTLVIYSRAKDGGWKINESRLFTLGSEPVTCLLPIGEDIFASCGNVVHVISLKNSEYKMTSHPLDTCGPIQDMVRAGVGLWVAVKDKPTLKLYHLETFEGLQVMDIDRAVARAVAAKEKCVDAADYSKNVSITCLLVTRGLLWIGTSNGIILTIPLPRLEGVPRIHSSPTVACHAHNGPVKFLVPICCGLGVPHIIDRPQPTNSDTVQTSTLTQDTKSPTQRLTMSLEVDRSQLNPVTSIRRHSSGDDVTSESDDVEDNLYDDAVTISKAQSTPNLLDVDYGGEYINLLYGSLMRRYSEVEFESSLNEKGDYMSVQATKADVVQYRKSMSMTRAKGYLRSFRTKSVPVIPEKDETDDALYESYVKQHTGAMDTYRRGRPDLSLATATRSKTNVRESMGSEEISKGPSTHGPLCRSVTVVTGGEGYCNWNKVKAKDLKNLESCLLLWQCTFPSSLSAM